MISLMNIQWREPLWLLLALYPMLMFIATNALRRLRQDTYAQKSLLPWVILANRSKQKILLRHTAFVLAWLCFAIALAGPRTAQTVFQTESDQYAEIMIVLDLSQSMAAKDVLPDRLQRARLELLDFLQRAEQLRIGLTVFAARPHLVSPMTYDKSVIRHYLAALKPGILPTAGSDIIAALDFASKTFTTDNSHSRAILLVSDGNSAQSLNLQSIQTITEKFNSQGINVYSIGIGTLTGQAVVSQLDPRYAKTQTAITTLQRNTLQKVTSLTNGAYTDVSDSDRDWQQLYDHGLANLAVAGPADINSGTKTLWHELYHLPLLLALLFFLLAHFTRARSGTTISGLNLLVLSLCITFATAYQPLEAAEATYLHAYQAYQKNDYERAREIFAGIAGYQARLGEANALYQLQDYANARNVYIQTILLADNDIQRANALFNLGNCLFQLGDYIQAAQVYKDTLRYQHDHASAQNNLTHAERLQAAKDAEDALSYRAGRGPRMGRTPDNIDLSNTQVSLGDASSQEELLLPDPEQRKTVATELFNQTELASQQLEGDADDGWTYQIQTPAEILVLQNNLSHDNRYVWQRLFEQEEGFPAPLSYPYPLGEVAPW